MKKRIISSALIIGMLLITYICSMFIPMSHEIGAEAYTQNFFLEIVALLLLSFISFYLSKRSGLPIFVTAIALGLIANRFLSPIIENKNSLYMLVSFCATLILFSGGLETSFQNFKKMFWKIISLSFFGLLLTAVLFSVILNALNFGIAITVCVLLGAILASTDPAAIIPTLSILKFKNNCVKDLIISESAVTDVSGTMITLVFIGILTVGTGNTDYSIMSLYKELGSIEAMKILSTQLLLGIGGGILGYLGLYLFKKLKFRHEEEFAADLTFFFALPILIYWIANKLGGSGYLAAFIAGLMNERQIKNSHDLEETEHSFNQLIDGMFKPLIFLILGALVDPQSLIQYAPVGILISIIFMFVIRPIAVFASLYPINFGKEKLSYKDMLFISFVRETGAIPAVLLVITASTLTDIAGLIPIGMWVILMTLIVQPILTAKVAEKLKVATR